MHPLMRPQTEPLKAEITAAFQARQPIVWECMGQVWHDHRCRCDHCLHDAGVLNKEA
jgi:hypothetical protein